jgi:uncharacterized OB-fold protein
MSTKSKGKEDQELLSIKRVVEAPYNYNAGYYVSRYLNELKENRRIVGVRCPNCKRVYAPPRVVCSKCFEKTEEFCPLSDKGTIMAFTITTVPYTNPNTGEPKELPFTAAYIRIDGTDSCILHCLEEKDQSKIKTGMRVQAVFSEERSGDHFTDIRHFRIINE